MYSIYFPILLFFFFLYFLDNNRIIGLIILDFRYHFYTLNFDKKKSSIDKIYFQAYNLLFEVFNKSLLIEKAALCGVCKAVASPNKNAVATLYANKFN